MRRPGVNGRMGCGTPRDGEVMVHVMAARGLVEPEAAREDEAIVASSRRLLRWRRGTE